jgi:carbon-monoxide dehydrogenase medium subunit
MAAAERMLAGKVLADDRIQQAAETVAAECSPAGDFRASADYRRATAGVLTRRALQAASRKVES